MADSLRDQLIAAGYEAPKKEEKRKPRPGSNAKDKTGHRNKPGKKPGNKPGNKPGGSNKTNKPAGKHSSGSGNSQRNNKGKAVAAAEQNAAIEERKKLKAQIKTLIDDNKLDNWKGESVYRYLVEKRIRELYVTEELHKQLAERLVAVTRLNGDTYLVPREIALSIKEINPQWSVFNVDADTEDEAKLKLSEDEKDYADYKVPDDLKW